MAVTPDRHPGESDEEGLVLENLAPGNDPTVVGGIRYVNGAFRQKDAQGVYDPRVDIHGADIASAGTVNLDTATGNLVDVTGTATITAVTLSDGRRCTVRFTGILTLTHGASLVLPGVANITTAAGDFAIFQGYAAGVVRCVVCSPLAGASGSGLTHQQVMARTLGG